MQQETILEIYVADFLLMSVYHGFSRVRSYYASVCKSITYLFAAIAVLSPSVAGWQEAEVWHQACKKIRTSHPQRFFFRRPTADLD